MEKRSVLEFESYKDVLVFKLTGPESRGQLSRAAEALHCQVSFLSRVIKTEAHLTLDQSFLICKFWKLTATESEYFTTLVESERAAEPAYRKHLTKQLSELKKNHESLANRTAKNDFPIAEQRALYFSSWHWAALHFLVSIPEMSSAQALSARLGLSEPVVDLTLKRLEEFGLVSQSSKGRWAYASGQFHLPKDSPFVIQHHQNWRSRAVLDSQNPNSDGIHYTTVLTLSRADAERIKNRLLEFISETVKISAPSDSEDAVVLNCDLFKL